MKKASYSFPVSKWGLSVFLTLALICGVTVPVGAQSSDIRAETSEQLRELRRIMEQEDEPPELEDTAPRMDQTEDRYGEFGRQRILRRRAEHEYFSLGASVTFQSNDNVRLSPDVLNQNTDENRVMSLSGGFHFNLPSPYTARLNASYQSVDYLEEDPLNYDFFNAGFSARRQLPLPGVRSSIGLNYTFQSLLYGTENPNFSRTESVYDQHVVSADFRTIFPISRYEILTGTMSLSNESTTHVDQGQAGGESDPEKTRFSLTTSYRYQYSRLLSYNASYQFRRDWYRDQNRGGTRHDRMDYTHLLSSGINLRLTDFLNLGFNVSYTENHSNFSSPASPVLLFPQGFTIQSREYDSLSGSIVLSTRTRF